MDSNNSSFPTQYTEELMQAIVQLKDEKEARAFFRDLLTIAELTEFANRWQIVKLLLQHKPYAEIAKTLGVSTATVTRVAHWLNHGMGGYKNAAEKLGL